MKINYLRALLACFYSIFSLWGFQLNQNDSVSYFRHPFIFILLALCFYLLIAGIDMALDRLERSGALGLSDRKLMISGLVILIVWIVAWLALFPGLAIYDGPTQLWQFRNNDISTHHPYIHTAFLVLCDDLARLTGFGDYSFFNSMFQLVFQWLCCMRLLFVMRKLNCKTAYLVYTVFFMALYPPNAFLALTTTKDTIFTGFFILLLCEIAESYTTDALSAPAVARMILFGAMMSVFRNNGIYVFIAAFPFVLLMRKRIGFKKCLNLYCGFFPTSPAYISFCA